jgi:hypothetical protein
MPCKILTSELRDVDEIDKEKFTMYNILMTVEGREDYQISRRYSQFNELLAQLTKENSAVKQIVFPPKVLVGKLAPKVIEKRTQELEEWLNALLSHSDASISSSDQLLYFCEAKDGMVEIGGDAPTLTFTDVYGRTFDSSRYGSDYLIIYSAASRYNFQTLTKCIKAADPQIKAKYPGLKCIYVNVADLRVVPDAMQGQVAPMLTKMDTKNVTEALNEFTKACPGVYNPINMFFTADWTGDTIAQLGCSDSNWTFRLFVAAGNKIVSSFQSATPGIVQAYIDGMDATVEGMPQVMQPWPEASLYPNHRQLNTEQVTIKAGKIHPVEFTVDAVSMVGWKLQVLGAANTLACRLVRIAGEGVAEGAQDVILPKRKVECKDVPYTQVVHCIPGMYRLELDNKESTFKSKDVSIELSISDVASA